MLCGYATSFASEPASVPCPTKRPASVTYASSSAPYVSPAWVKVRSGRESKRTVSAFGEPSQPPWTPAIGYFMPTIQVENEAGTNTRFTTLDPAQPRHSPAPPVSGA